MPGTDHAAIATEVKVVDALRKEGLTKNQIGREKSLERPWDWKKEYGGRIVRQRRKLMPRWAATAPAISSPVSRR